MFRYRFGMSFVNTRHRFVLVFVFRRVFVFAIDIDIRSKISHVKHDDSNNSRKSCIRPPGPSVHCFPKKQIWGGGEICIEPFKSVEPRINNTW